MNIKKLTLGESELTGAVYAGIPVNRDGALILDRGIAAHQGRRGIVTDRDLTRMLVETENPPMLGSSVLIPESTFTAMRTELIRMREAEPLLAEQMYDLGNIDAQELVPYRWRQAYGDAYRHIQERLGQIMRGKGLEP